MKELNIIEEEKNPLFDRKKIEVELEAETTPSREDILILLSKKFSTEKENIKIKSILGKFGSRIFTIKANIYNSKQEKDNLEIKKKKEIEAEKREEAKLVEQEKPVEESKEEIKNENSVEEPKVEEASVEEKEKTK